MKLCLELAKASITISLWSSSKLQSDKFNPVKLGTSLMKEANSATDSSVKKLSLISKISNF